MKRTKNVLKTLPHDAVYDTMDSPVGLLTLFASEKGLYRVLWECEIDSDAYQALLQHFQRQPQHSIIQNTKKQLKEYFDGKRQVFDLPLCFKGTPFQIQAWKELYKIPYGQTISYGEQAKRLGDKNKARAVGLANGLNPISIIVPCHRVIGSNGDLTGFGGGLDNKAKLLELEKSNK